MIVVEAQTFKYFQEIGLFLMKLCKTRTKNFFSKNPLPSQELEITCLICIYRLQGVKKTLHSHLVSIYLDSWCVKFFSTHPVVFHLCSENL